MKTKLDKFEIPLRATLPMIFIIDNSSNTNIADVNNAMKMCTALLKKLAVDNDDNEIKVAILQFSSNCIWRTSEKKLQNLDKFNWQNIRKGKLCNFGKALNELNDKLTKEKILKFESRVVVPNIILISTCESDDCWQEGLKKLKENNWFKNALKFAIVDGANANKDVLKKFTENNNCIFYCNGKNNLEKYLASIIYNICSFFSTLFDPPPKNPQKVIIDMIKESLNK